MTPATPKPLPAAIKTALTDSRPLVCYLLERDRTGAQLEYSVADLKSGKVYFWKVVAETQDGIAIESKTRRFEVKN